MNRAKGFTVIELMVAVAMLAILAGIALPAMRGVIQRNQVSSEVNRLLSELLMARNTAVTRGQVVTICRSGDQVTCLAGSAANQYENGWITYVAPAPRVTLTGAAGFEVLKVGDPASSAMQVRALGGQAPSFISFLPSGRIDPAAAGNIVINVCPGGQSTALVPGKRLSLSVSGRPNLSELAPGPC